MIKLLKVWVATHVYCPIIMPGIGLTFLLWEIFYVGHYNISTEEFVRI